MLRRSTRALALTLALLTVLASPALAGGWAVATLDSSPAAFLAGETYPIGFTIRQHGVEPVRAEQYGGQVAVQIRQGETGSPVVFPARSDGPVGHYVADVTFPRGGGWSWEILQGPFAPQPLGVLTVQPATPALALAAAPAPLVAAAAAPAPAPALGSGLAPAQAPSRLGPAAAPGPAPALTAVSTSAPAAGAAPAAASARAEAALTPARPAPALDIVLPVATLFAVASATLALAALGRRPDMAAAACAQSRRETAASPLTPGPGPARPATVLLDAPRPGPGLPAKAGHGAVSRVPAAPPPGAPASRPSIARPTLADPAL
jgi:hypothetical protein